MAKDRFTPELDFINEFEVDIQNVLKSVGLEDRVYGTPRTKSLVIENTPKALRAEAWEWEQQAKASQQAFERVEIKDITMRDRTEDLYQLRGDVSETIASLSFANNALYAMRQNLSEMQHTTVWPSAKQMGAVYADGLRKTQFPDAITSVMDGGMFLAETADKIEYLKPGLVPKTPKQFAEKVLIPIIDNAMAEANRRMGSLSDGLEVREHRQETIARGQALARQAGEAQVTSRQLYQASELIRGVWSSALENGAMSSPELNSSMLQTHHPAEFSDKYELDTYIEEIAVAAKQDFDPTFKPALNRGAEGPGIA